MTCTTKNFNLARPYAKAIFALALKEKQLSKWSETLNFLGQVTADKNICALETNPRFSKNNLLALLKNICNAEQQLNPETVNLLQLLILKQRLMLLPAIFEMYEKLRTKYEKIIPAQVLTARPLIDTEQQKLKAALEKRLQLKVILKFALDKSLIGGLLLKIGDFVIDGSLRGRLQRLATQLLG